MLYQEMVPDNMHTEQYSLDMTYLTNPIHHLEHNLIIQLDTGKRNIGTKYAKI